MYLKDYLISLHVSCRGLLNEKTDRLGTTLHMLEARNIKLSAEVSSLESSLAAMSMAQDVLVKERDRLAEELSQLKTEKVG